MGYIFISYSSKDKNSADAINDFLKKNNIQTWMAPYDIPVGNKYAAVICDAIKNCSCFVLLLTVASQDSQWVPKEVERAINYGKTIIPIKLDNVVLNKEFELYISTEHFLQIKKLDEQTEEMRKLLMVIKGQIKTIKVNENTDANLTSDFSEQIRIGSLIDGKYRILSFIEAGFFCEVYLALNELTNKQWVIKSINKDSIKYNKFAQNLATEIAMLNDLNHPGIPTIIDIINTRKYLFVVMDHINGISLSNIIEDNGAQSEDTVLQWAIELSQIVKYLHSQDPAVIHNDLQPSNVMLTNDNKIMLIDFGVSQKLKKVLKEDDYLLGTAFYQAPEKFTNNRIDKRTDIFGIGVILYTAITGKVLTEFQHFSLPSVRKVNPKASKHIERIISKCIEFHPEDRYQCIDDLLKELNKANKGFQKHNRSNLIKTILSKYIRS